MARAPEPWERQPGDTDTAWDRFVAYREQTLPRGRVDVAAKMGITPKALDQFAHKYDYVARARAWDAEQQRVQDAATLEGAVKVRKTQLDGIDAMMERGMELVRHGPGDAGHGARMVSEGIKLRRLVDGAATARTETVALSEAALDGGLNLDALTDEERVEWRRLVQKMATAEEG